MQEFLQVLNTTGFINFSWGNVVMILAGIVFIYLAIVKGFEPLLLVPIGFGIVVGNIPGLLEQGLGVVSEGSVLNYLYFGVNKGIYPSLIFLGIGAMTDFSTLIANPKLILLGAAAQVGIFGTFLGALLLGFNVLEAASIGIIGGADGPTSIFLASKLAPNLIGPIALAAYSYMALVPVIQPPIMKLLTTPKERLIRMKPPRQVSKREKIFFPVITFLVTAIIAPGGAILLAMLFLGNLLKECGVTERLALTARTSLIDIVTVLVGFTVGAKTTATYF
jgi:oxaloacetate decarboxylase beta subunit